MINSDTRWWVRHLICQELEGVAKEARAEAGRAVTNVEKLIFESIALTNEAHASHIRGQLGAEAEQEQRDADRERERRGEWVPTHYDAYRQENS